MIPVSIGNLKNLERIMLHQNQITGSIPESLFSIPNIEVLQLQSNKLTGSIPTTIGNLKAARVISMSINSLQGTIPSELENLDKLEFLQFYQNQLTGIAPDITFLKTKLDLETYVTDCGYPSYALSAPVECDSCTMCCNSDGTCDNNMRWKDFSIVALAFTTNFAVPISIITIVALVWWAKSHGYFTFLHNDRGPLDIYKEDSVYCYILSDSKLANLVYVFTAGCQLCLLSVFLVVSNFRDPGTVWVANYRCTEASIFCDNQASYNWFGWLLFYILLLVFLGLDFCNSLLQIRKACFFRSFRLLFCGFGILFLTSLTVFTSYTYNIAIGQSNNDLLVNAVILLFINDLDEQVSELLEKMFPSWHEKILEGVKENLIKQEKALNPSYQEKESSEEKEGNEDEAKL